MQAIELCNAQGSDTKGNMGNSCVKPVQMAHMEADEHAEILTKELPAAGMSASSRTGNSKAAGSLQASTPNTKPSSPDVIQSNPRAVPKKACFADVPVTEWELPAAVPSAAERSTGRTQAQQP